MSVEDFERKLGEWIRSEFPELDYNLLWRAGNQQTIDMVITVGPKGSLKYPDTPERVMPLMPPMVNKGRYPYYIQGTEEIVDGERILRIKHVPAD